MKRTKRLLLLLLCAGGCADRTLAPPATDTTTSTTASPASCPSALVGDWRLQSFEPFGPGITMPVTPPADYQLDAGCSYAFIVGNGTDYEIDVANDQLDSSVHADCEQLDEDAASVSGGCAEGPTACVCTYTSSIELGTWLADGVNLMLLRSQSAVNQPYSLDGDTLVTNATFGSFGTTATFVRQPSSG